MSQLGNTEILKIQNEGYNAYLQGLHPRDNPYPRCNPEDAQRKKAWFRGYAASKTDRARANRNATTPTENP